MPFSRSRLSRVFSLFPFVRVFGVLVFFRFPPIFPWFSVGFAFCVVSRFSVFFVFDRFSDGRARERWAL